MRVQLAALAGLMIAAAPAHAVTVEAAFSEDFKTKLDEELGEREGKVLTDIVSQKIEKQFAGIAAERVVVTIKDAKPNRPTMQQVSDTSGLDPIRSFSIGGAKLSGVAYDASGKEIGKFDYKWYESDITQAQYQTTWHDARWAIDRFARRFAEEVKS
jgi:hypothetical protein